MSIEASILSTVWRTITSINLAKVLSIYTAIYSSPSSHYADWHEYNILCSNDICGILLPHICKTYHIIMQYDYVNMQVIYVNMQRNHVDIEHNYVHDYVVMEHNYFDIPLELCCMSTYMEL